MDKQIIIDGVDIKYCKRRIGKDNFCRYYKRPCAENNFNCIWKKYFRKEQECEELKKDRERWKSNFNGKVSAIEELLQQLDQLKQTNEELKKENDELKRQHQADKGLITSTGKMNYQLIQEYDKLKNCLTEIKEVEEKQCNICEALTPIDEYKDCKKCWQGVILQKISECEV